MAGEPITVESLGAVQGDAFRALLPADIQAKPYAKEINNFSDFVKKYDGAQVLLGQRVTPDDKSTPEQWAEFHGKTRPEKMDDYSIPEIEGVAPELLKKAGESKILREILHSASVSKWQANILLKGFLKTIFDADTAVTKQKDTAFTKLATDLFGDQKDSIITNGKKFLAANLPENLKPLLDSLDEKSLTLVLAATDTMAKKFTGEDPFRGGGGGGGSGETKEQLISAMQTIMQDPAYRDPLKDKAKNKQLNDQMNVIREKLKKFS